MSFNDLNREMINNENNCINFPADEPNVQMVEYFNNHPGDEPVSIGAFAECKISASASHIVNARIAGITSMHRTSL